MTTTTIDNTFQTAKQETLAWLRQEVSALRSSRVKPDIVERLAVESYGALTPLNGLASISSTDARTLVVAPWDKNNIAAIEKAISTANIGVQPVVDGAIIRLSFASLTDEVRARTIKLLHDQAEEARVRLRQARDESLRLLRQQKEKGDIPEDDFYNGKDNLDKLIEAANSEIAQLVAKKEEEIKTI